MTGLTAMAFRRLEPELAGIGVEMIASNGKNCTQDRRSVRRYRHRWRSNSSLHGCRTSAVSHAGSIASTTSRDAASRMRAHPSEAFMMRCDQRTNSDRLDRSCVQRQAAFRKRFAAFATCEPPGPSAKKKRLEASQSYRWLREVHDGPSNESSMAGRWDANRLPGINSDR